MPEKHGEKLLSLSVGSFRKQSMSQVSKWGTRVYTALTAGSWYHLVVQRGVSAALPPDLKHIIRPDVEGLGENSRYEPCLNTCWWHSMHLSSLSQLEILLFQCYLYVIWNTVSAAVLRHNVNWYVQDVRSMNLVLCTWCFYVYIDWSVRLVFRL